MPFDLPTESLYITKEMIANGLDQNIIHINSREENGVMGLHATIGDYSFYFGTDDDIADMDEEEFFSTYTKEDIVDMIHDTIESPMRAEDFCLYDNEWDYYHDLLLEAYESGEER